MPCFKWVISYKGQKNKKKWKQGDLIICTCYKGNLMNNHYYKSGV
jgi:hypothetical protein